jgi:hypothetical protein
MNKPPLIWDPSLLINAPTSYIYDPKQTTDRTTGKIINSSSAINQSYTLRKLQKPSELISTNTAPSSSFTIPIIITNTGQSGNISDLPSSDLSAIYTDSFTPAFNACTADPTCWGIGIKNTQPAGSFGAESRFTLKYIFQLYQKPPLIDTPTNTPAPTYDPIERLSCDPSGIWYTFIKNTPGAVNPAGALSCPAIVTTNTDTTAANNDIESSNAPAVKFKCPDNPGLMSEKDKGYYFCNPTIAPIPSIWSKPTTWIIVIVTLCVLGGIGYYYYKKRQSDAENIDYSKYFKKKGGYFFFN